MTNQNFSIVVQGIYFDNLRRIGSTANICNEYLKYTDNVILSCYDNDKEKIRDINPKVKIVYNSSVATTQYHVNNLYWQTKTIIGGLSLVDTERVIKSRTDEFWENLDLILTNDRYFTSCNVCAQYWNHKPFHLSDHLFNVLTRPFLSAAKKIYSKIEFYPQSGDKWSFLDPKIFDLPYHGIGWGAEMIYLYKYLEELQLLNKDMDLDTLKEIVKQNCFVIPIESLGNNSLISISRDGRKRWWDISELSGIPFLKNILEL